MSAGGKIAAGKVVKELAAKGSAKETEKGSAKDQGGK